MDNTPLAHPSEVIAKHRIIRWTDMPNNVVMEFELISYMTAKTARFCRGGYIIVAALSLNDYPQANEIEKDEYMLVHFSYKTFVNAINNLSPSLKQICMPDNMNKEDNLYIKFKRVSDHRMIIYDIDKRDSTPEHLAKAEDMYKLL